jgi:hypothetical protein
MRQSSTGKIRVNGDPDDAPSAHQATLVSRTGEFFMPFLKSNSAAREALAQVIAGGDRVQYGRHDRHR